ncbi:hypothetical protein VQ056_15460 [Paenibacillus sp. JTLBN-2024]
MNADQVRGSTPQTDAYYKERWLASVNASGLPRQAIEASIERRKLDMYTLRRRNKSSG